jgi:REP element-mobilizing transposase RayT
MTELPTRKFNRLPEYDYTRNGAYFVTICAKGHECLFGEIEAREQTVGVLALRKRNSVTFLDKTGELILRTHGTAFCRPRCDLSKAGRIVVGAISNIAQIYDTVEVDCFVIMPNHVHMILVLDSYKQPSGRAMLAPTDDCNAFRRGEHCSPVPTVSQVVQQWKGAVTKQLGYSPWQRSFYDHVIRNDADYQRIVEYMDNNPYSWEEDCYYHKPSST